MLSYAEARRLMASCRNKANGKPIQNNTRLYERGSDETTYYVIRLHNTDIVEIYSNGTFGLRHDGWTTITTRDRLYGWSPLTGRRLQSESGDWFLRVRAGADDPEPPSNNHMRVERPYAKPPEPPHGPERQYDWKLRAARQRWETWHVQVDYYGSLDAWRSAWREDRQRVVDANRVWRAWNERNRVPWDGLVIVNGDGYPLWSEVKAVRKAQTARRRAEVRARKAREAAEREAAALERFKARVRRQRKPTFEQRAAEVAAELAGIADGLKVTVSTNDSQEVAR